MIEDVPRCPVCGERTHNEKSKQVCRSSTCIYRIVVTCCEFD